MDNLPCEGFGRPSHLFIYFLRPNFFPSLILSFFLFLSSGKEK